MDKGDLGSGSVSGSDMGKKLKSGDSVKDSVNDSVDNSMDDPVDDFEDDDAMLEDNSVDNFEDDFDDYFDNYFDDYFENYFEEITEANFSAIMSKEVLKVHEEYKEKAKKYLKDFEGKITLSYEWLVLGNEWTRDHIKGPILHERFTCVTAHFIDDNWKVRKWILGYSTGERRPLDDLYPYYFRTALQGFEIESKVSTILLPNDEDFDEKTVGAIKKCIQEKAINPPVFQVYCCADIFRLMVDDLYSAFRWGLYEDVRMLVGWGRLSSTNWNVKLYHLQQAVELKNEDAFSKDEIYDNYDKPSDEEWIQIRTFCKLTGCIFKVAKELFEERYSTSNLYFHLLAELKAMLKQELAGADNDYFLRKATNISKMFDKYWNDMFLVLATASVLDPRFKMKYVEFYCSKKIDNGDGFEKAETVLDYLRNLYARYAASIDTKEEEHEDYYEGEEEEDDYDGDDDDEEEDDYDEDEEEEEEDYDEEEAQRVKEEKKEKPDAYLEFVLFQEFLKFEGTSRESQEMELDAYLNEPVMEWNKDFKVLEWWKEESQKYPILSRVARDILSIPISRATSYDAYVSDKREPAERVLSVDPKVANAMMCGKSWMPILLKK